MTTKPTGTHSHLSITVELSAETLDLLTTLGKSYALGGNATASEVILHLIHSAADGVRRPGSWERGWLEQAFGEVVR
jgi:hypothetical protein